MSRAVLALCAAMIACAGPEDPVLAVAEAGPDLRARVGEVVTLDGSASTGVSFRWAPGDGEIVDGAVVEHAYAEPGVFVATLEARGSDGVARSDTTTVTVTRPPADTPPTRSAPLALDEDGRAWLVVPEADLVVVVAGEGRATAVAVCDDPRSLAIGAEAVAVACAGDDSVALVRLDAALVARVALPRGSRPISVAHRPLRSDDGDVFVVALEGLGAVVDVSADGAGEPVPVGPDPRALAVLPDDRVLVSRFRAIADAAELYVVGAEPIALAYDPGPDTDTNHRGVPHLVEQIAVSPDGGTAYLPGVQSNTARGPSRDGRALTFETMVRAHLTVVDVDAGVERFDRRKVFDDQGRALAVALAPGGGIVWVSHPGTGVLHAVDAFSGAIRGSILGAGRGVIGLAVSADGQTLLAYAWLDRQLHAYDLGQDPPARRWSVDVLADSAVDEPLSDEVLLGQRLFWEAGDPRMGRAGYLACAHCHPDGGDDGVVWDFGGRGEGVRNTIPLHGRAGTAMGRLHWTGNFDEIQDFEHDLRGPNGGQGLLAAADWAETDDPLGAPKAGRSAELDALAAYAASLDRTPPSPFPEPEGGAAAFRAYACVACHPPPLFTDSTLHRPLRHRIGTVTAASGQRLGGPLDGLDTPTLLGVHASAPYLHDGSAGTVEEAIEAHLGLGLGPATVQLLADYVRSL